MNKHNSPWADPEGGGQGVLTPPENHKNIGFLSNTDPDPLKITKLPSQHSMLAIIGTPAKHHLMVFRWWADDGPFIVVFASQLKKKCQCWTPLTKLSGSAHDSLT